MTIGRRELRFGDQGFALQVPQSANLIAPGATQQIALTFFPDTPAAAQRADILLLDVQSGGQSGRYGLGVWSP